MVRGAAHWQDDFDICGGSGDKNTTMMMWSTGFAQQKCIEEPLLMGAGLSGGNLQNPVVARRQGVRTAVLHAILRIKLPQKRRAERNTHAGNHDDGCVVVSSKTRQQYHIDEPGLRGAMGLLFRLARH